MEITIEMTEVGFKDEWKLRYWWDSDVKTYITCTIFLVIYAPILAFSSHFFQRRDFSPLQFISWAAISC